MSSSRTARPFDDRDRKDAAEVLGRVLGEVRGLECVASNHNCVLRARAADGRRVVLKLAGRGHDGGLAREPAAARLLRAAGVPGAAVLRADVEGRLVGRAWVLSQDAGRRTARDAGGLSPIARRDLFAQIGRLLARVHAVAFDAPGDLASDGTIRPAAFARNPAERWHRGQLAEARRIGVIDSDDALRAALDDLPPADGHRLCHGDFNPGQCVRRGGRLTAVVDWESAHAGDADYEAAAFEAFARATVRRDLADAAINAYAGARPNYLERRELYRPVRVAHAASLAVLFHRDRRGGLARAARQLAAEWQAGDRALAA